jgi:hypothetical protein
MLLRERSAFTPARPDILRPTPARHHDTHMTLAHVPLADLDASCREETSKFLRHESARNDFCWEVMRRAICERDHAAWDSAVTQYRGLVLSWVHHHPASNDSREGDDFWVNRSFERLWSAVTPDRFSQFADLPALLKYLKMCVHSVLLDDARARRAVEMESLDRVADSRLTTDVERLALGETTARELWQVIAEEVPDEAERLVVYWSFALEMKPGEIHERSPERYATVAEVYRIKRNVLDRLRRSSRLKQFAA